MARSSVSSAPVLRELMWALRPADEVTLVPSTAGARSEMGVVVTLCMVGAIVSAAGVLPLEVSAIVGVASVHGGLIAAALVWAGVGAAEASVVIVLLALARTLTVLSPLGEAAYLVVPLWLGRLAESGRLTSLGLGPPWPWGAVAVGALTGATLALHLVTCASRTLGYDIRFAVTSFVPGVAYDIGANVISAELFFRGALLQHLWRRWSFGSALTMAAAAAAVRYCIDPFVAPIELRVGAAVYMSLLALLNGALYRWSGSLLPGLAAATVFFACYRLIATG